MNTKNKGKRTREASLPFVSVVVTAYNEEYVLADCILSLQQQDYDGDYEIIVVNNASTDRTPDIAYNMGVRVVNEPKKGYVYALKAGFANARGEIIASTDADTVVPSDWLKRLVTNLISHPNVAAVSGGCIFYDGKIWLNWLCRKSIRFNWHLIGSNMAIWRSAYEKVGGFDPNVNMGADTELGMRLRRRNIGHIRIDRQLLVLTSARRFQKAFWSTLWLYFANDLSLILLKKPLFFNFPDIRLMPHFTNQQVSYARRIFMSMFGIMLFIACFFFVERPKAQILGKVMAQSNVNQPVVSLTFDDGPNNSYTTKILDILAHYHVRATFFVIGKNAENQPALARRIVREGHVIGNHTYTHPFWAEMEKSQQIKYEIDKGAEAIKSVTGVQPTLFRPPHGWRSPWMIRLAKKEGYTIVTWSVSPDDWQWWVSPKTITNRVLSRVKYGDIILLHDGIKTQTPAKNTIVALPSIIEGLQARGYHFVTVPEMLILQSKNKRKSSI